MSEQLLLAAIPALAGWVLYIDRKVASYEEIIKRIDKLVDILLEERLAQGKDNRPASPPFYRSGGY